MGRKRTGSVKWAEPDASKGETQGHYVIRLLLDDGSRPWVHLEPGPRSKVAATSARNRAAGMNEQARKLGHTAANYGMKPPKARTPRAVPGESVSTWWERYHDAAATGIVGRRNAGKPQVTIQNRRSRFRDYIEPHIGTTQMNAVTRQQVHAIVRHLNALIRERIAFFDRPAIMRVGRKPGIMSKTAHHVWSELRSGFREACTLGEDATLLVRDDDPTDKVTPPITVPDREQAALYPSELLALLSCEDVPMYRKMLYAVAGYTGVRAGELRALRVRDIDVEHGLVHVRHQRRKNSEENKATKTRAGVREIPIHAHLMPLLENLVEGLDDDEPLLRVPPAEDCAEKVRIDLRAAKCDRAELFEDSSTRQPFNFHGLRHTCLTHWAMTPGATTWSLLAAGHTDLETSKRYIASANILRAGRFGEPHPPLPKALIDSAFFRLRDSWKQRSGGKLRRSIATPMGIESSHKTASSGFVEDDEPSSESYERPIPAKRRKAI